ncbi:MAG: hypothetical protein GYB65_23705 [Chloroflexi bacterium]|nr:hypothetical protein [Chloroflexota bacterium]
MARLGIRWLAIVALGGGALAALSDGWHHKPDTVFAYLSSEPQSARAAIIASPLPTRTLVPVPVTPTITPTLTLVPSITPTELPAAWQLTPTARSVAGPQQTLPPAAQHLIVAARDDLTQQPDVDATDIRLLAVERVIWEGDWLGCPARFEDGFTETEETPGFRILFTAGSQVYAYHTDSDETFVLCEDSPWELQGEPLPFDPVAWEIVEITRRNTADSLDVDPADVTLVSLLMLTWPDASIGCPQPDVVYDDLPMLGYRISFEVGDEIVIYHTSIRHATRCSLDEEILPGFLDDLIAPPEDEEDTEAAAE